MGGIFSRAAPIEAIAQPSFGLDRMITETPLPRTLAEICFSYFTYTIPQFLNLFNGTDQLCIQPFSILQIDIGLISEMQKNIKDPEWHEEVHLVEKVFFVLQKILILLGKEPKFFGRWSNASFALDQQRLCIFSYELLTIKLNYFPKLSDSSEPNYFPEIRLFYPHFFPMLARCSITRFQISDMAKLIFRNLNKGEATLFLRSFKSRSIPLLVKQQVPDFELTLEPLTGPPDGWICELTNQSSSGRGESDSLYRGIELLIRSKWKPLIFTLTPKNTMCDFLA